MLIVFGVIGVTYVFCLDQPNQLRRETKKPPISKY